MSRLDKYLNEIYTKSLMNNYVIRSSPIHGNGIFTKGPFRKGDFINTHFDVDGKITEFGAFLNHSSDPTARSIKQKDNSYRTYAEKDVKKDDEITLDYTINKEFEQPEEGWK